jgi:hypothetical protein
LVHRGIGKVTALVIHARDDAASAYGLLGFVATSHVKTRESGAKGFQTVAVYGHIFAAISTIATTVHGVHTIAVLAAVLIAA